MPLVGAYILPHGALILDHTHKLFDHALHMAVKAAAETVEAASPELIVLVTPHGVQLEQDFAVYTNETAQGTAEWDGEWKDYSVSVQLDVLSARALPPLLRAKGIPAQGVSCFFGPGKGTGVLRWGEVVPLWFLSGIASKKLLIITVPSRRFVDLNGTVADAERFGDFLHDWIAEIPQRTVLLISGDLAHTHSASGPFGLHASAVEFDSHIRHWAGNPLANESSLCVKASDLVNDALACGFVGMRLLHRVLRKWKTPFTSHVHHYGAPTYYGMIVVSMAPQKSDLH